MGFTVFNTKTIHNNALHDIMNYKYVYGKFFRHDKVKLTF